MSTFRQAGLSGCLHAIAVVAPLLSVSSAPAQCQLAKITAADAQPQDYFGAAVGLSESRMIVGAHYDDDRGPRAGAAYVFVNHGGPAWHLQQKIYGADTRAGDVFGSAVAIDEPRAVVGAFLAGGGITDPHRGAAYVFHFDGDAWTQEARLQASDGVVDANLGISVGIDGDYVIAGAPNDGDPNVPVGAAYVFHRNGSSWTQQAKLRAPGGDADHFDHFGIAVGLHGDIAVVGAKDDDERDPNAGAAYVFRRSGTVWAFEAKLTADDGSEMDLFGQSVAVFGDTVVVGAYADDGPATNSGSAYVFQRIGGVWSQRAKLVPADGVTDGSFGISVAAYGDTIAVGSWWDDEAANGAGAVYLYRESPAGFDLAGKVVAPDGGTMDNYGVAVGLSSGRVAVGAWQDDEAAPDAGAAYVLSFGGADCNGNGTCDTLEIPDIDGDSDVDLADLAILLSQFGSVGQAQGDVDGDGDVDLADLASLLANFGSDLCP